MNGKVGYQWEESKTSLAVALNVAGDAIDMKGGNSNLKSEGLLRECTGID